jgi:hypothetical protein
MADINVIQGIGPQQLTKWIAQQTEIAELGEEVERLRNEKERAFAALRQILDEAGYQLEADTGSLSDMVSWNRVYIYAWDALGLVNVD